MTCSPHRAARGSLLIEVLVSILLLVFGILGLVALQALMTQAQTAAKGRADASYLGNEAIGLMWADLPNLAAYDTSSACANGSACAAWRSKVAATLPNAVGTIAVTLATGEAVVRIDWVGSDQEPHSHSARTLFRP